MIQGISHITLVVKDIEKTSLLFQYLLDATEIYSSDKKNFSLSKEKFLLVDGIWIALMQGESISRTYNHIAFHVQTKELPHLKERVRFLGMEVLPGRTREKGEGDSVYFCDYDGHLFELHSGLLEDRVSLYRSEEGVKIARFVQGSGSIRLWVESIGDQSLPAVVLVAGAGAHAHFWSDEFCKRIVEAGYCVIRFDHRDTGYSSSVDYRKNPYTVFDLATDVLSILDAFHIEKAHVVGHSMGGIIAQILGCYHQNRIKSFVSMSVATVGGYHPSKEVMNLLLENKLTQSFDESIHGFMNSWKLLNGELPLDEEMATKYTKEMYDRSFHQVGVAWNHIQAQNNLGTLVEELKACSVPRLFLHGEKDVLISAESGKKSAAQANNAPFECISHMGHMFFHLDTQKAIANRLVEFFVTV